jgi:hypothetical protein
MANAYINRQGGKISRAAWLAHRKDRDYVVIKEFENDRIFALIEWLGVGKNAENVPQAHWKLYRLNVENIVTTDGEGRPLDAPRRSPDVMMTREFRTEKEALEAYEDLLVRFGGCEWLPSSSGEGGRQFVERDNVLLPPPPDVPDTRGMDEEIQDIAGSW